MENSHNAPFFSILICTVGKPDLVREAIRSITAQTFKDFEIIVTDCSGTDAIFNIVASENNPKIFFHRVPENDPSAAWDYAYSQSRGTYVLWYDDDNCLVPWALQRFYSIIIKEKADIVSANHAYYYGTGNRHNTLHKNSLGILLPFTGLAKTYKSPEVLKAIFSFTMGGEKMPARWHSAASMFSRALCEKVRKHTRHVITPHLLGNFHIHPLMFAFAECPIYDDRPMCVIGKFASSITQQWSNVYATKKDTHIKKYEYTGVSARTLGNTTAECYLTAQKLLPNQLNTYTLDFPKFYTRYINELILIDVPLMQLLFYWKELWQAVHKNAGAQTNILKRKIVRGISKSLIIRGLRLLGVYAKARNIFYKQIPNPRRKYVELAKYHIQSISDCARHLDEVCQKEFGIAIQPND